MKNTITLQELRQTKLYKMEQTRDLTHFLKKNLSNQEIIELGNKYIYMDKITEELHGLVEFANAILEKTGK
jgi:hypothetical protein